VNVRLIIRNELVRFTETNWFISLKRTAWFHKTEMIRFTETNWFVSLKELLDLAGIFWQNELGQKFSFGRTRFRVGV
jgi:hypothetical protein